MDFSLKKPFHLFAAFLLGITIILLTIVPIFSILGYYPTTQDVVLNEFIIIFGAIIAIFLLVGTPILWYFLVNDFSIKEILKNLQINFKELPNAIFWAFIAITTMYIILILIGIYFMAIGYKSNEITNIEELANNLTLGSVIFIVLFQSTSEEIFFRGFLLEKFSKISNQRIAIIATAIMFGLAHLSYGKLYPAIMTTIFGIILGIIVVRTKNLLSAILTHVIYNGASFILFFIVQTYNIQAIIL
jgi:membrane protease YdiL (CAAX protease family)